MNKQTITVIFSMALALGIAAPGRADIILTLGAYDGAGYDFVSSNPPASTTIGDYLFAPPAAANVTGITISGTFGNGDSATTALSDYFINFSGGAGSPVEVASCDNPSNDCFSDGNGPTAWSYTFTQTDLSNVTAALNTGSLDFTYTMDAPPFTSQGLNWAVYAGAATIDIETVPEPATLLLGFGGILGIAALRRFRKA